MFSIALPKFFSTEEIKIIEEVFKQRIEDEFLLWLVILNFDNFIICLNNLHILITYTKKQSLRKMKKKAQFRF